MGALISALARQVFFFGMYAACERMSLTKNMKRINKVIARRLIIVNKLDFVRYSYKCMLTCKPKVFFRERITHIFYKREKNIAAACLAKL